MTKKRPRPTARYAKAPSDTPPQPPEGESSLVRYARDELERAGYFKNESDYVGMLGKAVMDMMALFASEDHSGMSAGMTISIFTRLANFQPLTPLTGAEDEWSVCEEREDGRVDWQNKRCSSVFRKTDADGKVLEVYDIRAECLVDTLEDDFVGVLTKAVTFPYSPPSKMARILRSSVEAPKDLGGRYDD